MFNQQNQKEQNAVETLLNLGVTDESQQEIDYDKEMKKFFRKTFSNSFEDAKKIIIRLSSSNLSSLQKDKPTLKTSVQDQKNKIGLRTMSLYRPNEQTNTQMIQQHKFLISQFKSNRNRHSSEYRTVQIQSGQLTQTLQEFQFNFVERPPSILSKKSTKNLPKYFLRFKKRQ